MTHTCFRLDSWLRGISNAALAGATALAAVGSGCSSSGSGDAIPQGVYQVSSNTKNTTSCDGPGTAAMPARTFFQLKDTEFLGVKGIDLGTCTGQNACTEGGLFWTFLRLGGEWKIEEASSSGTPDCTVQGTYGTVETTTTDDTVHIEIRKHMGMLTGSACDAHGLASRAHALPCVELEIIDGMRVGDVVTAD